MHKSFLERIKACQHFKGADVPDPVDPAKVKPPAPSDAADNLARQRKASQEREKRGFRSTIYSRGILSPPLINTSYGTNPAQPLPQNNPILGG